MHALLHRALAPQTVTYACLLLTVALTLALALAQSALASAAAPAAAGPPAAHALLTVPLAPEATHRDGARACHGIEAADDARAAAHAGPIVRICRASPRSGLLRGLRIPPGAPARSGPDLLAALYAGAGPHGPPSWPEIPAIPVPTAHPGADLYLDSSLRPALAAAAAEVSPPLMPATAVTA